MLNTEVYDTLNTNRTNKQIKNETLKKLKTKP